MDGPGDYHPEKEKDKHKKTNIVWNHLHVESKNNESTYKTEIDSRHRKQTYGTRREREVRVEQIRSSGLMYTHFILYKDFILYTLILYIK